MGFYDAKGYWRSDGDGFYDAKGNWVSPGCAFYDSKGYLRSQGDGFYDSKGNWVSPGDAFYDGKGYLQTPGVSKGTVIFGGNELFVGIAFLLFFPIAILWLMTMRLIEWMTSHLYLIFVGYMIVDAIFCFAITKVKDYRGKKVALGFVGNFMSILSLIYITLVYAVPYMIINDKSIGSFVEFTIALAVGVAGIAILQYFNYYHQKAVLEFILGILFFVIVIRLLKYGIRDMSTMESLAEIYNVKVSALFKVIFGLAF